MSYQHTRKPPCTPQTRLTRTLQGLHCQRPESPRWRPPHQCLPALTDARRWAAGDCGPRRARPRTGTARTEVWRVDDERATCEMGSELGPENNGVKNYYKGRQYVTHP